MHKKQNLTLWLLLFLTHNNAQMHMVMREVINHTSTLRLLRMGLTHHTTLVQATTGTLLLSTH